VVVVVGVSVVGVSVVVVGISVVLVSVMSVSVVVVVLASCEHFSPAHPSSQTHVAPEQVVEEQDAEHVPWPLQCSLFVPDAVLQLHRLQELSQSFHLRYCVHVPQFGI
jgi:hypothetical protein